MLRLRRSFVGKEDDEADPADREPSSEVSKEVHYLIRF